MIPHMITPATIYIKGRHPGESRGPGEWLETANPMPLDSGVRRYDIMPGLVRLCKGFEGSIDRIAEGRPLTAHCKEHP